MKKNKTGHIFFYILILAGSLLLTTQALAQRWCNLCGMDLEKYNRTRYILIHDNRTEKQTCSIHCAAILLKKHDFKKIKVADYLTGNIIDAENAYYIIESDIKGVMSKTSKLAFADKKKAVIFQKNHGGKLTDFKGALSATMRKMQDDMVMLKNKIKNITKMGNVVAEANSCFTCHGKNGLGVIRNPGSKNGIIPPWNRPEITKYINSKGMIKEIIMTGKKSSGAIQMPGWKKQIKGKELHALANYIWSLRDTSCCSDSR